MKLPNLRVIVTQRSGKSLWWAKIGPKPPRSSQSHLQASVYNPQLNTSIIDFRPCVAQFWRKIGKSSLLPLQSLKIYDHNGYLIQEIFLFFFFLKKLCFQYLLYTKKMYKMYKNVNCTFFCNTLIVKIAQLLKKHVVLDNCITV